MIESSIAIEPSQRLSVLTLKARRRICGVMSGTSADSIDVAICGIERAGLPVHGSEGASVQLEHFFSHPIAPHLSNRLQSIQSWGIQDVAEMHVIMGEAFAEAVNAAIEAAGRKNSEIDLVASHGQTVYHHSRRQGAIRATLQLGSGEIMARRTGLPIAWDFRAKDIAEGGEGAPLTPYADMILFGRVGSSCKSVILNLGGIANITVLSTDPSCVTGFDTGPANAPLDRLARKITGGASDFDLDGKIAAAGNVDEKLLAKLLADDSYLPLAPPKSSGFESYGDAFIDKVISMHGGADADLMSTVLQFVVVSIADAIERFVLPVNATERLVVAGGGGLNRELMRRLQDRLGAISVVSSDSLGIPGRAREAMAFAILGNDALFGLPTSLPSVTGARRAVSLGCLSVP